MASLFEKLTTNLSPNMYLVTLLVVVVGLLMILYTVYKVILLLVNLIGKKKLKLGKDGVQFEDIGNPVGSGTELYHSKNVSEENLVTLIIELQDNFTEYSEKVRDIKMQTIEDQLKKFRSELKSYIVYIEEKYLSSLEKKEKIDVSYSMLFKYWFETCFDSTQYDIRQILDRNHLKYKTTDEYTDIINQLYDTTYGELISEIENAPAYIKDAIGLKNVVNENRNLYRDYIDNSLQTAKKLSECASEKSSNLYNSFVAYRMDIIKRTFPTINVESIINVLK